MGPANQTNSNKIQNGKILETTTSPNQRRRMELSGRKKYKIDRRTELEQYKNKINKTRNVHFTQS